MRVYFTTVVQRVPISEGGEIVCLDWKRKRIVERRPMIAAIQTFRTTIRAVVPAAAAASLSAATS